MSARAKKPKPLETVLMVVPPKAGSNEVRRFKNARPVSLRSYNFEVDRIHACRWNSSPPWRRTLAQESRTPGATMADVRVSEELAKKFATEKDCDTPYQRWVRSEGLEIIGGHYVPNLRTVELNPWPRRGGRGVYINHDASRTSNDCYVCEIPPGMTLAPQRQ